MDDNRTMAQLLEAPTEGYEDAIVVPEINANNFEIKHGLLNLVQNKQFFGHDKEDPHAHIRYFNKITSTMKFPNVPIAYGNPSLDYDPIVSNSSPTLTPFGDSDFLLLEEANAFIAVDDEPISREIDATYYVGVPPEIDSRNLATSFRICIFGMATSYQLALIAKDLKDEEKAALIKVLKSHKRAIAWKLSDIKGVDPEFCTHKILMEVGSEQLV
ncbi:hypothetical protein Tco_0546802 [Tanacetum coccineum]